MSVTNNEPLTSSTSNNPDTCALNSWDSIKAKFWAVVVPVLTVLAKTVFRFLLIKITLLVLSLWLTFLYLIQFRSFDYFIFSEGFWAVSMVTTAMMLFFVLFGVALLLPGVISAIEKNVTSLMGKESISKLGWIQWTKTMAFILLFWVPLPVYLIINILYKPWPWETKQAFLLAGILSGCFVYASLRSSFKNFVAFGLSVSFFFLISSVDLLPHYSFALSRFGIGGGIKACVVTMEGKRIVGGKLVLRTPHNVYLSTTETVYSNEDSVNCLDKKEEKIVIQSLTEGNRIVFE